MMTITLICVGRLKDEFFTGASREYEKRLKAFCKTEIIELSPAPLPDEPNPSQINAALEKEADIILKKIPLSSRVYCLCVEGEQLSSKQLALEFEATALSGTSNMVFIIGGSHGIAGRVKSASHVRLSMSKMTFPHRLARIMLLEQIYRAFTINVGRKYHK